MTHARQQIREAVATLLRATPTTWATVFETRIPKKRTTQNFLMVFADGETSEHTTVDSPANIGRSCSLVIAGHLRLPGNNDTETVEDQMDAMAAEVETKLTFAALRGSSGLSHLLSLQLKSTEMVVLIDEEGQPDHAELTLAYEASYYTLEGVPATMI